MSTSNSTDPTPAIRRQHQLLKILQAMSHPACKRHAIDGMLHDILETFGLHAYRSEVRSLLETLEKSGLVSTKPVDDCIVVELTEKGERVGLGKDRADGIAIFYLQ